MNTLRVKSEQQFIYIGCIYRSPNSEGENDEKLKDLIKSIPDMRNHKVLLLGDFNHPQIDWENETCRENLHHPAMQFLECTQDAFLFQHVQKPTRHRMGQQSNILDLIFTNEESLVEDLDYGAPLGNSDHCSITFNINVTHTFKHSKSLTSFNYYKGDYEALKLDLNLDWESEFKDKNTEQCWLILKAKIVEVRDKYIPRKHNRQGRKKVLWMNENTLRAVKKKQTLWKKFLMTKSETDYNNFARARNQARWVTRKAKKKFEEQLAKEVKTNPKAFWNYVRSKTQMKKNTPDLDKDGSSRTTTDEEKANVLNDCFKKVFTSENLDNIPTPITCQYENELKTVDISEDSVLKKLAKLEANKAAGADGIHPKVLAEAKNELAKPLALLFRKLLATGN